jgi:predicted RNA-binding protein with PUA-like domain
MNVDVRLVRKTRLLPLAEMRECPALATMRVLQRGNRLSITPVAAAEWRAVQALLAVRR